MFRIFEPGLSRRELLRVGGLSSLGLSLPDLLKARAGSGQAAGGSRPNSLGRARNVLFLWLQGGPPQHETFDPKPDAPAEIRGEFRHIATNVPGIDFCELLPRTARIADKLAVVRSMATANDLHDASGYWILTGQKYVGRESRQISPTDWPYFGSLVKMLKPGEEMPDLSSVWLPDVMRLNDNVTPAGQTGGFLGKRWDPDRFVFDAWSDTLRLEGLSLPDDVTPLRLSSRRRLLDQVNDHFDGIEKTGGPRLYDAQASQAYGLLTSGKARQAFDLSGESPELLRSYGGGPWAKCLVLGRRLIEAGARLVHVNWPREGGDTAVNNPMWDTHAQNSDRLQNVLCPMFDVGFTALIDDMSARGLLDETLVVAIGEFGRTPKINAQGGRDHWGHVFSFVMAGAGISTAQVYGSSDRQGAYAHTNRLEPQDLVATIFHLLGIGHDTFFRDLTDRPIRVTHGEPIWPLIGESPATATRREPGGDIAFGPAYSSALLLDADFPPTTTLKAAEPGRRIQGWQAHPLATDKTDDRPACWQAGDGTVRAGYPAVAASGPATGAEKREPGEVLIAQELRNPRAGRFEARALLEASLPGENGLVPASSEGWSAELVVYGYLDGNRKDLGKIREFARVPLKPSAEPGRFEAVADVKLRSQDGGAAEIERGVGLMVRMRFSGGAAGDVPTLVMRHAGIVFDPRPRNDDVTV